MIPTVTTDHGQHTPADDSRPRFFLDDAFDANPDGDWWLDLGVVALPTAPAV